MIAPGPIPIAYGIPCPKDHDDWWSRPDRRIDEGDAINLDVLGPPVNLSL